MLPDKFKACRDADWGSRGGSWLGAAPGAAAFDNGARRKERWTPFSLFAFFFLVKAKNLLWIFLDYRKQVSMY